MRDFSPVDKSVAVLPPSTYPNISMAFVSGCAWAS